MPYLKKKGIDTVESNGTPTIAKKSVGHDVFFLDTMNERAYPSFWDFDNSFILQSTVQAVG
jgi:hypothetical protein